MTPLHYANSPSITSLLIKNNANVNAQADNGDTPILEATMFKHLTGMKLLIAAGADVNQPNNDGTFNKESEQILINAGAKKKLARQNYLPANNDELDHLARHYIQQNTSQNPQ